MRSPLVNAPVAAQEVPLEGTFVEIGKHPIRGDHHSIDERGRQPEESEDANRLSSQAPGYATDCPT
ncbi:unnamed protein product [marine sediment metagenome]|uniref:Uncharacterized protein n=1 Tax=marine sediment metagenome TaxID=412755 RepID=X0XGG0_9ZZZZ